MANHSSNRQGPFDFLDRLVDLFHHPAPEAKPATSADSLADLSERFETALLELERKIEEEKRDRADREMSDWRRHLRAENEEQKKARERSIHNHIREDIEAAHLSLGTGISSHEIDRLREYLEKMAELTAEGEKSQEVIPRCRVSILKRIHREAGALALNELDGYMNRSGIPWPEMLPRDPTISPEEKQDILKRKELERKQDFCNYSIRRSSLLIVGIVEAWKSDYPDSATPLWKMVVLEAVATALRARLMHRFSSRLREDRAVIESKAAELLGSELVELNKTMQGGLTSIHDAHRVVASSLKILDEIIPELAWEHLQAVLPEARGEIPVFDDRTNPHGS